MCLKENARTFDKNFTTQKILEFQDWKKDYKTLKFYENYENSNQNLKQRWKICKLSFSIRKQISKRC